MGPAQPKPSRKRHRKRKRRVASDSSSSEDDSSSSSSDASKPKATVTIPVRQAKPAAPESVDSDESEDDVSSSSDDPQNDSEPDQEEVADVAAPQRPHKPGRGEPPPQRDSPSPEPNVDIPPLVTPDVPRSEQVLKEKFRGFWMAAIAEGFKDDLEEIRKEPNLGPSRLALLIESLASGADVFSSSTTAGRANEMEIVLDQLP
ncbi:hypothetical protein JVU11DRAFT_1156 [Chiua virens]|nr:hypothetical protein JVU11DRAFT_1156 [Chiua virens]